MIEYVRLRGWYNFDYTGDMKTAISIPDPIFQELNNWHES